MNIKKTYCGFVSIIGRSNVGKSTILNKLLGKKISITSRKPQTTRYRIMGIETKNNYQIIYIDTPGFHINGKQLINRLMNKIVINSIRNVELIIFVVEGTYWTKDDEIIISKLKNIQCPILLVINKIDYINNQSTLISYIKFFTKQMNFVDIIPISAIKGIGISKIHNVVHNYIPESIHLFSTQNITNRSQKFIAAEIIREKLIRFLGDELPYVVTVIIEQFYINHHNNYTINSIIFVERNNQKKIIIGHKGDKIKKIAIKARIDMENYFVTKVYLKLWVKVKLGWTNNEHILRGLGYVDDLIIF